MGMDAGQKRNCLGYPVREWSLSWKIHCLATFHGYLPLLQQLQAASEGFHSKIFQSAALGGQLETVQWLSSQEGFKLDEDIFAQACEGGHWESTKWLRSEGCPWDESTCSNAAGSGHFEILKWLRSEGCSWCEWTCWDAAGSGHLEILKWLRSQDPPCPCNEQACEIAAQEGHLEVLKFLRSEGCPWDGCTWKYAAESSREWLEENGCPQDVDDEDYWID